MLILVLWMQNSNSDGSNFGLVIGLIKIHHIFQNRPLWFCTWWLVVKVYILGTIWKKNLLRSFIALFHLPFKCQQMCLLSPSISKPGSLRLSIPYSTVNSKVGRSKSTTFGMNNLISILLWNAYYTCTT